MHALIVDDDEPSCQLLEKIIQQAGFTADWTTNSRTGLDWAVTRPYDIFLLDIYMPELTGTELAIALKERLPTAKIILIAAFPDGISQRVAHDLEVPLLSKPFSPKVLLSLMFQVVLHGGQS